MRREDASQDSKAVSKKRLTPLQYHVTQEGGTEPCIRRLNFDPPI
jgi:peptide methionine sulfoxide reductase MsrB